MSVLPTRETSRLVKIPCPVCDADTVDGLPCRTCTRNLRQALSDLPGLLDELTVTATRQSVTSRGGGRSSDDPLPFDWASSDQHWAIRNTLLTWVREIELDDLGEWDETCRCTPYRACPGRTWVPLANDPAEWCRWLGRRVERIRGHADAGMMIDEITACADAARHAVDLPGDGAYCGTCDICGRPMYAPREAAEVVCRYCERAGITSSYSVTGRRQDMASKAEDASLPKAQILDVAPAYGLTINPSTFRTWTSRGQLLPRGDRMGVPLYRLGDALNLQRAARAAELAAKAAEAEEAS